jgi:putative transferase (TIGR04331 family)
MSGMNEKNFNLVTTAIPGPAACDSGTIMLGQWCIPDTAGGYSDTVVSSYHWDDRAKYYDDYLYLGGLYEKLLEQLSISLNARHGLNASLRYWRVIVGPWLRFFTDILFDRFESLKMAVSNYSIQDGHVFSYDAERLIPRDFMEFFQESVEDEWNHMIFAECMKALDLRIRVEGKLDYPRKPAVNVQHSLWRKLYGKLVPDSLNDIVFVSPAVKTARIVRLQLALGQMPWVYIPRRWEGEVDTDHESRAQLVINPGQEKFEQLLGKLVKHCLPKTYLEAFKPFRQEILASFPRAPKAIYTGNAYQADDSFKIWCAEMQEFQNVPLLVGQHGGNMGVSLFNQTEDHQKKVADRFLSWGWTDREHDNVVPFQSLKILPWNINQSDRGKILITTASYPRYFYCHYAVPVAGQYIAYINDQLSFLQHISPVLKDELIIRPDEDKYGWSFVSRLEKAGYANQIDNRNIPLYTALDGCRLVVGTANSTIYLEALANNFPTVVFFDPGYFELREDAIPVMSELEKCGIYHPSPVSAASFINRIHDHVAEWWSDEGVQAARRTFCRRYALAAENDNWNIACKLKAILDQLNTTEQVD